MPVADHEVHPSTAIGADWRYGCWNRERTRNSYLAKDGHIELHSFATLQCWRLQEDTSSLECRHDKSLTDRWCEGCKHAGSGEKYAQTIAASGTKIGD